MANLNAVDIKMLIKNRNGDVLDISQLVTKVTVQGDYTQGARRLDCSYIASSVDNTIPNAGIQEYDKVFFYQGNTTIFFGGIYEISKDSSSNEMTFYAYDNGAFMLKNKCTLKCNNNSITSVMELMIKTFNMPVESYIKSDLKIDKIFFNQTFYDIVMTMYTMLSKQTGKKYMIEWTNEGKMKVVEKGKIVLEYGFNENENLVNTSYTLNIDNMINRVVIYDDDYNYIGDVRDEENIKLYGIFQEAIKKSSDEDVTEEAKSKLQGAERKCTLSGFGDYTCVTGRAVKVKDNYTGLVGLFYIDADTHKWENGLYSIDLELNFQNLMNEVDKSESEKEETTSSSSSSSSKTTVTGGKEVDAEFTAYYPANDTMQGGFYDAMGNRLDASKLTCACPKEVPFNTKIQVKGTGTSRDNLVYTCTDRGGAIKIVNGVYKIDLLMATKAEAYAFGRRKGKALIGVSVTQSSSSSSSGTGIGASLVKEARKHLGKKYVWGATGPTTFDCSGLTMYCHKQLGINIPRTSLEQSKNGTLISKSSLKAGDLVFFKTTSAEVGHVGMYIGNNEFIHAPNSKSVVKIDSLTSSYYSSRYVRARRYW